MMHYSIEWKTTKYVKGYGLLSFPRNLSNKYGRKLLDTGIEASKTASKKVKAKWKTGNKIADKIAKPVEEKIIPQEKKRRNIKQIKC